MHQKWIKTFPFYCGTYFCGVHDPIISSDKARLMPDASAMDIKSDLKLCVFTTTEVMIDDEKIAVINFSWTMLHMRRNTKMEYISAVFVPIEFQGLLDDVYRNKCFHKKKSMWGYLS